MVYLFVRNVFAYIHGLCRKSETRKKNFENLCKRFWIFDRKREYRKEKTIETTKEVQNICYLPVIFDAPCPCLDAFAHQGGVLWAPASALFKKE